MSSKSSLTYSIRAVFHSHPVARKLFMIAEAKRSNLIISADFNNTNDLLECADCKPLPALDTYKVID